MRFVHPDSKTLCEIRQIRRHKGSDEDISLAVSPQAIQEMQSHGILDS
jgi:hypothetical protein